LVKLDVGKFLLESEGITHLIEKESNHDIAPAFERIVTLFFGHFNRVIKFITKWETISEVASDCPCEVE
jgi:hypothetical protein